MKGSSIARYPSLYGLEVDEKEGSVRLSLDFEEKDSFDRREAAAEAAARMYQRIFSSHMRCAEDATDFWHFVDQTGFFYLQKVMHRENPYRTWARCIDAAYTARDTEDSYARSFSLRKLATPGDRSRVLLIDIAKFSYASVLLRMAEFVSQNQNQGCLEYCVRDFSIDENESDAVFEGFWELLRAGMFVPTSYFDQVENPNSFIH